MDEAEENVSLVAPDEAENVEKDDNDSVETYESAIDSEEQIKYGETTASLDKDQNFIEVDLNLPTEPKSQEEIPELEEQVTESNDNNEMPQGSSSEIVTTDVLLIKDQSFDEPMEQESLDKTTDPASLNETIGFIEKSINISQINVSLNNDDSNDAFNALKVMSTIIKLNIILLNLSSCVCRNLKKMH